MIVTIKFGDKSQRVNTNGKQPYMSLVSAAINQGLTGLPTNWMVATEIFYGDKPLSYRDKPQENKDVTLEIHLKS